MDPLQINSIKINRKDRKVNRFLLSQRRQENILKILCALAREETMNVI